MTPPLLGEICALTAPMCWSIAVILFRQSSAAPAVSLNLFKNVVATVLLALTMGAFGIGLPTDRPPEDWARLAFSGLLGLAVADTLLFEALRRIGAARVAITDTIYAPTIVLLAWAFLGETPTAWLVVGGVAVVGGVSMASRTPKLAGTLALPVDREMWFGTVCALGSVVCTAVGIIIAKPVFEDANLIEVTFTRLGAGVVGQVIWITLRRQWPAALTAFHPSPLWRTLLPATLMGTYVSLILWLGGFKWADASVAAVLNQLATVYILFLARFVLGETLTPRQVGASGIAILGATVIVLSGL